MARTTQRSGHALARLILDVTQHHPGTVIDISLCRCRTNAAGSTGDDRDFTFKTLIHFSLHSFNILPSAGKVLKTPPRPQ